MEIEYVFARWLEARWDYPEWRKGQALFNALYDLVPEFANMIRGTKVDPFHQDKNCNVVLSMLVHWLERERNDSARN